MDEKIYRLNLDEVEGMNAISFVDNPAIKIDWFAFSEQLQFKTDTSKQMVTSPIMLANTLIPRSHPTMGKFSVYYDEDTILQMMIQYMSSDKKDNIDFQHNGELVPGIKLVESYITGDRNKSNLFDIPKGSWVGSFYIEDKELYDSLINSKDFNGVSLDGQFGLEEVVIEDMIYSAIEDIMKTNDTDEDKEIKLKKLLG